MELPPPLPQKRPPGWWDRNWKWFVPLLVAGGILVFAGFIFSIFAAMRSSDAYSEAVARTKAAPAVVDAIGSPIKEGIFLTGAININGTSGRAELSIPVSGPKGRATIYVLARKALGKWHFERLVVRVDGSGRQIDLSDK